MMIVIDEWIIHFIREQNENKHKLVLDFLQKVEEKGDKFVTIENSPLMYKIYDLMKVMSNWNDIVQVQLAKYFVRSFVLDPNIFIRLDDDELNDVPDDMGKQIKPGDRYLVQSALNKSGSMILTTDEKLKDVIETASTEINVALADEFLREYDC